MSSPDGQDPGDPRARAAQTKRNRTRRALLDAAEAMFDARGWARTRVEDIAAAAGVSAATAYNHFPTKHGMIGAVVGPLVHNIVVQGEHDLADGRPVVEALTEQVRALARLKGRNRGLMAAFTAAVNDYTIRVGRGPDPSDDGDPRNLAPIPDVLLGLIEHGQATGELRSYPPAYEVSVSIVNLLMLRTLSRRDEPPEQTAELLLTMLFGTLRPELLVESGTPRPFARTP
jgi:AcrR family transcriptional regulator